MAAHTGTAALCCHDAEGLKYNELMVRKLSVQALLQRLDSTDPALISAARSGLMTSSYDFVSKRALFQKQAVREAATICPRPCKLTFNLLTLKVVSESRTVTWATSANFSLPRPLSSRLRPDVRDRRQTDLRRASSLNAPAMGAGA